MKLEHYAENKEFIKDMQTLSYEQRRFMTRNGAYQLHGPNPLRGKERKRILALLYGIEKSIMDQAERDPIIRCKAEIDFQHIKLGVLLEKA